MGNTRLLYIDHKTDLNGIVQESFTSRGYICDIASSIGEGIEILGSNRFEAVFFHWDIYCDETTRSRYREKAGWLTTLSQDPAYRNGHGEFDIALLPGGGIFIVHLQSEGYRGVRILTTGAGTIAQIIRLREAGLIDGYVNKPYSVRHLEDALRMHQVSQDTVTE